MTHREINWHMVGWCSIVFGPVVIGYLLGWDPRLLGVIYGTMGFGGLIFRLADTWRQTPVLVHAVTLLLIFTMAITVVGQYWVTENPRYMGPNPVLWPIVIHRAACVLLAIKWPVWIDRHYSPFKVEPTHNSKGGQR